MLSGRYRPITVLLSSLFIVLILSASTGKAEDLKCPVCAQYAAQALVSLDEQTKEGRYDTFCRMHYETPSLLSTDDEIENRQDFCAKRLQLLTQHLQAIENGNTSIISLKLLDTINSKVDFHTKASPDYLVIRKVHFSDQTAMNEFKVFSRELKQITKTSWQVLLVDGTNENCRFAPATIRSRRHFKNRAMEQQRNFIYRKTGCHTIASTELAKKHISPRDTIIFVGLPPAVSTVYFEKLMGDFNKKIIQLMTTTNIKPDSVEDWRISLQILRLGKKIFYAQRYTNGNTRTALFTMNILRLALGLPPFQQNLLNSLDSGKTAERILDDYIRKTTPENNGQEDDSSSWSDMWDSFYRTVFPASSLNQ